MRPSEYLHQIASNGGAVASQIGELAGAEIKPAIKGAATGSGLFAGAGFLGYSALKVFGIALAFLFGWIFWAAAGLSVLMSLFLGFCILGVLTLALVVVMGVMGKSRFKKVKAPKATIDEIKATLGALGPAIADGVKDAEDSLAAGPKPATPATPKPHLVRDPIWVLRHRSMGGTNPEPTA